MVSLHFTGMLLERVDKERVACRLLPIVACDRAATL